MSFADFLAADRRLVLLKALQSSAQYRTNAYLLRKFADKLGHTVSAERIEQDLAWLDEMGLITLAKAEGVSVATATQRGLDVADGSAVVPGVQRPAPGA